MEVTTYYWLSLVALISAYAAYLAMDLHLTKKNNRKNLETFTNKIESQRAHFSNIANLSNARHNFISTLNNILIIKSQQESESHYKSKYAPYLAIDDLCKEKETLREKYRLRELELIEKYRLKELEIRRNHDLLRSRASNLSKRYKHNREIYEKLRKRIFKYEEDLEYMAYGVYRPHFTYQHSEEFKEELLEIRRQQKNDIKLGNAWHCSSNWQVNDSYVQGRIMTKRQAKLMLRAFNGECDAAMEKVTWNNATTLEKRIQQSFKAINKLGKSNNIIITKEYLEYKIKEFKLYYELKLKIQEEKEEQRQIREAMREEAKLQKDIESASKKADHDRAAYEKALRKARKELEVSGYINKEEAEKKISEMQAALDDAIARKERALSQAQLTRAGHVYIISNLGCFGNNTFKIGMTRRLDPTDRIRELGGASVPFPFDIHGMVYSQDAPALESAFHRKFSDRKMNMINGRKEFFKVTINEIQSAINEFGLELKLTKQAEAQQYRETQAMIDAMQEKDTTLAEIEEAFPEELA